MEKSNIHYWLALKLVPRLAIHKKLALVESFGLTALFHFSKNTPAKLTSANNLTVNQLAAFQHPNWEYIKKVIEKSEACQSTLIAFDDALYPKQLKQIYDPPLVLCAQGNLALLSKPQLAIVGSRFASASAQEVAYNFAKEVALHGFVITSGLALGVDGCAHDGALATKTGTIAVVATGLDQVYPAKHRNLAKRMLAQNSTIISEFLPGTPPKPGYFPKRNRIISGLSSGVLVVEAAIKSGSLITARCAIEHNRDVFAIPSTINNPLAKGCHWLIQQGAKLVETSADIINELELEPKQKVKDKKVRLIIKNEPLAVIEKDDEKSSKNPLCNDALLASVGFEVTPVDKIVARSSLTINEVLIRLTLLELSGIVSSTPGGYLRLK
ncbi:MAG: DNA-processing protein DprA [Colwellia sp.]